jgi:hypothetical protein
MMFARGILYLPGIGRHHSTKISLGWQKQNIKKVYYGTELPFPRGYDELFSTRLSAVSVDYALPIAYPDWSFGFLGYIKRFSANLFFDYARNYQSTYSFAPLSGSYSENLQSFGAEFIADLHLLRIIFPIKAGIRGSWLPQERKFSTGLLFKINLN